MALAVWFGALAPAFDWYADREETLRRERAMAARMAALTETLPALREAASEAANNGHQPGTLLAGATDPLAAAALQQKLDELASAAGVRIGSEEILPAREEGDFHAISVRVTLNAPWRGVVALFKGMASADVPMAADEMQLRGPPGLTKDPELPIDASFTVVAYRAAKGDTR
jgi:general secretion pathway protein M